MSLGWTEYFILTIYVHNIVQEIATTSNAFTGIMHIAGRLARS